MRSLTYSKSRENSGAAKEIACEWNPVQGHSLNDRPRNREPPGAIISRLTFCSQRMSRVPAEIRCAFDAASSSPSSFY
jgi:hypothetical protein